MPFFNYDHIKNFIDILKPLFDILNGNILTILLMLAGVSILTVTIVDSIKPWIRPFVVKKHFRQWFNPPLPSVPGLFSINLYISIFLETIHLKDKPDLKELKSLISKTVGSNYENFYKLKLDTLFPKLDVAINTILDYPDTYTKKLLIILSGYDSSVSNKQHITDIDNIANGPNSSNPEPYLKSLTRLNRQIDGNLSIFRSNLEFRWARNLHILSFFISFLILLISYQLYDPTIIAEIEKTDTVVENANIVINKEKLSFLTFVIMSVIGAFLAPVAHNLAVAIQGAKQRATK